MRFSTSALLTVCACATPAAIQAFSPLPPFHAGRLSSSSKAFVPQSLSFTTRTAATTATQLGISFTPIDGEDSPLEPDDDDDEDEDDDDDEIDPYVEAASSEFIDGDDASSSSALTVNNKDDSKITSDLDWGGEYGTLAERLNDTGAGTSTPSKALFRLMTSESPNQAISKFLTSANPQVVGAMSGAVSSLLGGLSSPSKGIETIVKTTGDKVGNLCFQLQMTGYMFRNAEYVMALKELMNLEGGATLDDYRAAFDRLDQDGSGYIDTEEIEALLADVYDGDDVPHFEIDSFLQFFDSNNDGKISWQEFERGLGNISQQEAAKAVSGLMLPGSRGDDDDDDDDDEDIPEMKATISGMIEIELDNGQVIEVEANEYMESLKKEAEELKAALRRELGAGPGNSASGMMPSGNAAPVSAPENITNDGIASYVASRKNDLQSLTESVQPEIMETMKLLVDFVMKGGKGSRRNKDIPPEQIEMELPGAALQQLALWQLVLGYKLREAEATGDYMKLME